MERTRAMEIEIIEAMADRTEKQRDCYRESGNTTMAYAYTMSLYNLERVLALLQDPEAYEQLAEMYL